MTADFVICDPSHSVGSQNPVPYHALSHINIFQCYPALEVQPSLFANCTLVEELYLVSGSFGLYILPYLILLTPTICSMDVGSLKGIQAGTIRVLVWILSFLSFGYATAEFEVTEERLGVYRPEEHSKSRQYQHLPKQQLPCHCANQGPTSHERSGVDGNYLT